MYTDWKQEASFGDIIISHLLSCRSIKIQKQVLYELVQKKRKKNRQIFLNNLHRLNKKGIISFNDGDILINRKEINNYFLFRNIKSKPTGETQILVLFDIPEKQRKIRNWLRLQLKLWNFKMIQQSAWVGDGPLPKEFTDHLKLLKIQGCVKVYKLSK